MKLLFEEYKTIYTRQTDKGTFSVEASVVVRYDEDDGVLLIKRHAELRFRDKEDFTSFRCVRCVPQPIDPTSVLVEREPAAAVRLGVRLADEFYADLGTWAAMREVSFELRASLEAPDLP